MPVSKTIAKAPHKAKTPSPAEVEKDEVETLLHTYQQIRNLRLSRSVTVGKRTLATASEIMNAMISCENDHHAWARMCAFHKPKRQAGVVNIGAYQIDSPYAASEAFVNKTVEEDKLLKLCENWNRMMDTRLTRDVLVVGPRSSEYTSNGADILRMMTDAPSGRVQIKRMTLKREKNYAPELLAV